MNILLTGGAGYIGTHTAVALTEAGHHIVILDNFSNSSRDVLVGLKTILNKTITYVEGDIRDTLLIAEVLRERKIDGVIHLAGLKAVGQSNKNPVEYYANNVQGSISLLQAMKSENVKVLIFSSSATIYGVPKYLPIDENHPTIPINPYGRTKLQIEEILKDLALSDSNWKILSFRYFNPIGAHPSGLIREEPNGIPNNLMPYMCQVAMGNMPKLSIYGNDYPTKDGTGVRDYIHVMDLAEAHVSALLFLKKFSGFEAFNIGTGNGISVLELIKNFEMTTGVSIPFDFQPRRQGDVPVCFTLADKVKKYIGWSACRDITEMTRSGWMAVKKW